MSEKKLTPYLIKGKKEFAVKDVPYLSLLLEKVGETKETINFIVSGEKELRIYAAILHLNLEEEVLLEAYDSYKGVVVASVRIEKFNFEERTSLAKKR